jgi:hypothetical protein
MKTFCAYWISEDRQNSIFIGEYESYPNIDNLQAELLDHGNAHDRAFILRGSWEVEEVTSDVIRQY